ncbi:glucose-1-phosphate adenylyltransferase [Anaerotignum sp. MSJ-24]|uniref:glucose-1-phosphate adenylyltransferase n=1 Tax=Anaerotignum sp. MSJ-24 TaxID=2841521 RepID=UPI001C10E577|nr:glucose-1-phosphate adenylyltransferase [Anaerotignum sp. MSJ-24]MBU5464030.1 glucose-1-phosphate adenylyltransferase [Anaerotignum sp. MSJ-24]
MEKKEIMALLLAGGQGSRLGILTKNTAKPAVRYGGKYRIIDFPLSNCINSGIDTVGVLTQYQPLMLNQHIGIGIPWDLDRKSGGVTILAPHVKGGEEMGDWFMGTANAIYHNLEYIDRYDPEYVLILSGDHIYKMDYSKMLEFHKANNCTATIAVLEVPFEEASRFGIMNTLDDDKIYEFEEKPANPKSNLASMGIYIFTWKKLREALIEDNKVHSNSDFGMHIIPKMLADGETLYAYRFNDYWKDVGTIESYWQANMELIKTVPEFNFYDKFWKIYTKTDNQPPQYVGRGAKLQQSIASEGCEVYGEVHSSVLGPDVLIKKGAVVRDSILMENVVIEEGAVVDRCIIDRNNIIGKGAVLGEGENIPNELKPNIYNTGITVVGENSVIPDGVHIGKNCVIYGKTSAEDYPDGVVASGKSVIKEESRL